MKEKNHRLPLEYYRGEIAVSFTLCIKGRASVFVRKETVDALLLILADCSRRGSCIIPAYCYMPDHQHLVLLGNESFSDTWRALCDYKQRSGFWLAKNLPGAQWQKGFHDHVMRERESLAGHVRYILENAVRKGIVSEWQGYPFSGSIGCELNDVLRGLFK